MGLLKTILAVLFVLIAISLMFFYLLPFNTIDFTASGNYNFSINNDESQMQFYPNMRFASPEISYNINDCPLQKQNDMEYAFEIIQNLTPLRFYPVDSNEEISVTCDDKMVASGDGLFIAGEGGPKNITVAGRFDVISSGEILLIKKSNCQKPNIAIHELMQCSWF